MLRHEAPSEAPGDVRVGVDQPGMNKPSAGIQPACCLDRIGGGCARGNEVDPSVADGDVALVEDAPLIIHRDDDRVGDQKIDARAAHWGSDVASPATRTCPS